MRKQIILCLKVAWTVAALMILFMGTSGCISTDAGCEVAGNTMALFMVLLTLPTGIVFLPIAMALDDSLGSHFPSDFITQWTVLAIGGFIQWFFILPWLLQKPNFMTLNLRSEPAPLPAAMPSPVSTPQPIAISTPPGTIATAPVKTRARKQQNQIQSFDKLGRSPLERVLKR